MSEELEAAVNRLHAAILSEASVVGPHELDADGEPIEDKPLEGAVLQEWVIVMSWTDVASETVVVTRATSRGLPRHHENGLLHEALYDFG